jgi:hypothetical protein
MIFAFVGPVGCTVVIGCLYEYQFITDTEGRANADALDFWIGFLESLLDPRKPLLFVNDKREMEVVHDVLQLR